jgi:C4-dicarboxylate-specific signal transduction histidine kinase
VKVKVPKHPLLLAEMNPTSFRKVLQLLATNSADWLVRTEKPRVTITARPHGGSCEIVFSDNGPGIRKDLAASVFEPQFTTKDGGRGMGLTIAQGLIEQNFGRIEVITDGRRTGASIRIVLPLKRDRSRADRP